MYVGLGLASMDRCGSGGARAFSVVGMEGCVLMAVVGGWWAVVLNVL